MAGVDAARALAALRFSGGDPESALQALSVIETAYARRTAMPQSWLARMECPA